MNILNYLRPTKVYTAAEVHAEITAKVLLLMEQMKQQVEAVELPAEMRCELELLRSVGLTNSANMEALKGAEQRVNDINASRQLTAERIRLVQLMHKHYGPDVMLMRTEDFMALLDKYNLVCGFLEDYTGSVPQKNLVEIARAKDFLDGFDGLDELRKTWSTYDLLSSPTRQEYGRRAYNVSIEYESGLFLRDKIHRWHYLVECTKEYLRENPDALRCPFVKAEDSFFYFHQRDDYSMSRKTDRLLIAAPAQEMKNRPKIVERIRTEDPFVFSVTDCGVLIYSAWGDEGNDELVQKYRRLNEWLASCDAMKSLNV